MSGGGGGGGRGGGLKQDERTHAHNESQCTHSETGPEIELVNSLKSGTKSTCRHADSYGEHPLILLFCESPCGFRLQYKHRDILPEPSVR